MAKKYEEKRDFSRTPEPPPEPSSSRTGPLIFVVHKHAARRLHYDFRLEVDGVLKSWAVPKGPSLDPSAKRLAVMVEDHPLDYGSFEGAIPEGEYGAGQVIVWDRGTYLPVEDGRSYRRDSARAEESMRRSLDNGRVSILLRGQKLKGVFSLVKIRRGDDWLLIKQKDEFAVADTDVLADGRSAVSGLTIEELRAGHSS